MFAKNCCLSNDGSSYCSVGNSLIAEDHASGTKLPAIELVVMDAIGQSVSAGVSDSREYLTTYHCQCRKHSLL